MLSFVASSLDVSLHEAVTMVTEGSKGVEEVGQGNDSVLRLRLVE